MLLLMVFWVGCATEETVETGPPVDWQAEGVRWWRTGVDTTGLFRNLETLADMNVTGSEVTYVASPNVARRRASQQEWFERAVKQKLIQLYRNHPEVVDSLVEHHIVPTLKEVDLDADLQKEVDRFKDKSYRFLHKNYFQAPQQKLQVGRDIEMPYPASARERQAAGTVHVQVYVNAEGEPLSIELLESVDPDLDGIAMRTMTQMRWRPAYLMVTSNWKEVPAWTRIKIKFGAA